MEKNRSKGVEASVKTHKPFPKHFPKSPLSQRTPLPWLDAACHECWVLIVLEPSCNLNFVHSSLHPCRDDISEQNHVVQETLIRERNKFPFIKNLFCEICISAKAWKLTSVFFPTHKQCAHLGSGTSIDKDHGDEQPHNHRSPSGTGRHKPHVDLTPLRKS